VPPWQTPFFLVAELLFIQLLHYLWWQHKLFRARQSRHSTNIKLKRSPCACASGARVPLSHCIRLTRAPRRSLDHQPGAVQVRPH
jgi:hypothetical protein